MVLDTKEYISDISFKSLKQAKRQGQLFRKQIRTPLWLRGWQAKELGFNAGEEDFLLEPLEPEEGALFGRIKQPSLLPAPAVTTVPAMPKEAPVAPTTPSLPPIEPSEQWPETFKGMPLAEAQRLGLYPTPNYLIVWPDDSTEYVGMFLEGGLESVQNKGGKVYKLPPGTVTPLTSAVQPSQEEENPITGLLRRVYPSFGLSETDFLNDIDKRVREDPDKFLEDLRLRGKSADTIQVLQMFSSEPLTQEDVNNFFQGQPEITPEQNLMIKALPLLVNPRTIDWANKYFSSPTSLRRELVNVGRNPDTEALVKSKFPSISEQGLKDYFSQDFKPVTAEKIGWRALPLPKIITPAGNKIDYPMSDAEWGRMTPDEKEFYKLSPQSWLAQHKDWEKVRVTYDRVKIIAEDIFGIKVDSETTLDYLMSEINALLWAVPIPLGRIAQPAYQFGKRLLPKGVQAVLTASEQLIKRIANIKIGGKGEVKVATEVAEKIKGIAKEPLPEAPKVEVKPPLPEKAVKPPVVEKPLVEKAVPEKVTPVTPEVTSETHLNLGRTQGNRLILEEAGILTPPSSDLTISEVVIKLNEIQAKLAKIPTSRVGGPQFRKIDNARITLLKLAQRESGLSETGLRNVAEGLPPPKVPLAIPKAEIPKVGKIIPEKGITEVKQTEFVNKYVESKGAKLPPPVEPPIASVQMPSDMSAAQQVANHISFDPDKIGLREKFLRGKNKAMSQWIDKLYPIDTFTSTAKKLGAKISLQENPYIQARLLEGVVSKATTFLENGTFGRVFWKMEKGKAIPNFKGKGLSQILDEVKAPEAWRDFSTYLTSLRAKELEALGIKTGIDKDIAIRSIAELETKYPRFVKLSEDIQKYQSDLLDYIQESGLISADLRKTLETKYASYVPFHRILEELQGKGYMGKKMVDIVSPIKRIKGSEREIINPLESITKNTYAFLNAADRNEVGVAMARLVHDVPELAGLFEPIKTPIARVAQVTAKELGMSVEGLSDDAMEGVFNIFRPSMFTPDDVVTVLIDGQKRFFKVDADLKTALTAMDTTNMGMLWKVLSSPAKWLRAGATLSPDFAIRNPLRDQMSAMIYSNYGFIPGVDFLKGVAHIIKKDATYRLYKMSGAEHSMLVSLDREYLSKSFKEVVEGKGFTDYVKHPLSLLQIASELGEKATRLGEFAKGIKRGVTPLEAGFSSREVTLDFAKAGTQAKAVNQIIAFFNAQIRDPDRMIQAFKEHPIRTATKMFAFITSPSLSLWAANHDDPRWKEIPQWQKDLSWIVMTDEHIYRIPKPFGVGQIFGSAPERLLDYLETKDPTVITKFLGNFFQSAMPGLIPTGAEPVIENITNHSFFRGTPVVPESKQDLPPELQYTEYTSEVAKRMGRLLKQSPMKIDNILYGWTGGLGRYATEAIDKVLEKTGIVAPKIEPSPTLADIPIVRAFVVRNPIGGSSASVSTFYDELDSYTSIEKLLKGLIEDGKKDEFEKEKAKHPELLFAYDEKGDTYYSASARYLRRVSGELSDIRKLQDKIYKSTTMTPEKKRELIDALDVIKTEMARRALELIRNPSKETGILETPVEEIEAKMGTITGDPLSSDVTKLTDIAPDLVQAKGDSPLKKLLDRNNTILADIANLPDTPLYQIDRATTKAGLTRRQNELLDQYESATDKKAFLVEHPELKENPKQKWLRDNPEANAILALWGNAKLLTQEAYDIAIGLVERNDIPDNALEERILPPKGLAVPYFSLMEAKEKFGDSSWEAKLILAKNKGLVEWNPAWALPDTPIASLELKVKNRANFDKLDGFSDKDSPDYIEDENARAEAVKKFKADNPQFVDDTRRIEAIEKGAIDYLKTIPLPPQPKGDEWILRPNELEIPPQEEIKTQKDIQRAQFRAIGLTASQYHQVINSWIADHPEETAQLLEEGKRFVSFGWITDPMQFVRFEMADVVGFQVVGLTPDKAHELTNKLFPGLRSRFDFGQEGEDPVVNAWVERGKVVDEFSPNSAEAKLWLIDHPDIHKWALDNELLTDTGEEWNIPVLRINAQFRKQDEEYDALPTTGTARQDYLTAHKDYATAVIQRNGYNLGLKDVTQWQEYYELPEYGFWRERYRKEHPEFDTEVKGLQGKDAWADIDPSKIPNVAYDEIYEKYQNLFDQYEDAQGTEEQRREIREALFAENPAFKEAYYWRAGYGLLLSDDNVDDYVTYMLMPERGWGKERYMKLHPEFYEEIKKIKGWKTDIKWDEIPSEQVEALWFEYDAIPTQLDKQQQDFRIAHPDLDAWLVLTGKVKRLATEERRRTKLTPREKSLEDIFVRQSEFEKDMAELRKKLGGL